MHLVHEMESNGTAQYLVVSILYELDTGARDDNFLTSMNLTNILGVNKTVYDVDMSGLGDWVNKKQKYNYKGSLTTDPCTESVEWFIVNSVRKINAEQLAQFTVLWSGNPSFTGSPGNARDIQAKNRRQVYLTREGDDNNGR